jgi:endonuclease
MATIRSGRGARDGGADAPAAAEWLGMRLVIATCSVDYRGRLSAHLPSATRLLLVKADGSVSDHADGGAFEPLGSALKTPLSAGAF